jgi:hypothetical protein
MLKTRRILQVEWALELHGEHRLRSIAVAGQRPLERTREEPILEE